MGAPSQDVGSVRFNVAAPPDSSYGIGATAPYISLSPDGRTLAFIAFSNGVSQVWLRSLDSLEALPLKGTEGVSTAASPALFWSPDSRFIGFFAQGKLKKIGVAGGPAQTLCDALGASGTWNRAGVILFDDGGTPPRTSELFSAPLRTSTSPFAAIGGTQTPLYF